MAPSYLLPFLKKYFTNLFNEIPWTNDEAVIYGKHYITKRKVAWYGDAPFSYSYSGNTRKALKWTNDLIEIKQLIENTCKTSFNSCLLNLYHNGQEGMAWHSDDEKTLLKNGAIASFSLGATRKFMFKHKTTKETIGTILTNGSLLLMMGSTQSNWLHSLPKTTKVTSPRINLTFRTIVE